MSVPLFADAYVTTRGVALPSTTADKAEPWDRREERRPGSNDDVGRPVEDPAPLVVPLARGERAVQEGHALAESCDESRHHLRGERDLGHQDDRTLPAREHLRGQPEVDLGLPAAGDAVKEVAAPAAEPGDDRADRGGLRCGRGHVLREVRLAQAELDRDATNPAHALEGEATAGEAPRGGGRAARVREFVRRDRAGLECAQRDQLSRAELRRAGRERVTSRGGDGEDRLRPLAARRRQATARAGRERRREHGAHRVGETAAVRRGHPARERELAIGQQRDRMHQAVERLQLAVGGDVERDDDAVDRPGAEARAHEVAEADIEAVGDAVGEGARGTAEAGEHGDLGRAGHNS
jgi:hypothetical protein